MKLLILLLSLIFVSCSNNTSEKIYTKTTISTGTIEDGEVYHYINNFKDL